MTSAERARADVVRLLKEHAAELRRTMPTGIGHNIDADGMRLAAELCDRMASQMAPTVVLVIGNDWEGIYVDGALKAQGHSIAAHDVFYALGIEPKIKHPDEGYLEGVGSLPERIADLREALR